MNATNFILVAGAVIAAIFFLNPRLSARPLWRATITPLASIIGSGFLIALSAHRLEKRTSTAAFALLSVGAVAIALLAKSAGV